MKLIFRIMSMLAIMAGMGFSSCSEQEDVPALSDAQIILDEPEVRLGRTGRYYEVEVQAPAACTVQSTAEWLTLTSDTLPPDGVLEFYVTANDDDYGRSAEIRVSSAGQPDLSASLSVYQCGWLDSDDNALAGGELTQDFRVGWGYNILQEFMSENSLTAPVLDYNKLLAFETETGDRLIQEDNRSYEKIEVYSAGKTVELYINGAKIGRKGTGKDGRATFKARYASGTVTAVAYDEKGKELGRKTLKSGGKETKLTLLPEEAQVSAENGLCYVRLQYTDKEGTVKPLARGEIRVQVEGGKLLGLGSACSYNPTGFLTDTTDVYYGEAMAVILPDGEGTVTVRATSPHGAAETKIRCI